MALDLCSAIGANQPFIDCDVRRGIPKAIVIGSGSFVANDYATAASMKAAIKLAMKLAAGTSGKLFPFPEVQGVTDKTDATKEATLGLGFKEVLIEGKPGYEFDMIPGTILEKHMRKFNRQTVPVFIYDDKQNFWGRLKSDGTTFVGYTAIIFVQGAPFGDGQKSNVTKCTITFTSASEVFDSSAFVPCTTMVQSDFTGLKDVVLAKVSNSTNVYKISGKIATDTPGVTIDSYPSLGALMLAAYWVAGTGVNYGTSMPITSVAVDATLSCWTVTLDTTTYSALASTTSIQIKWVAPSTLDAAGITDVEGVPVVVVKP